jgi:hypothetical protein
MENRTKRIAVIEDLSCIGRCSLGVAMSVLPVMGVEAALLACVMLAGVYYYSVSRVGITLFPLTSTNIAFLISVVLLCGLIITFFASLAATNRYIRMKTNKLYEI